MALFEALCRALERLATGVTVALLAAIVAINGLEIVLRTFFATSLQWIYETNLLLASWMYFLGIYLVYRRSGDIAMVGFTSLLPPRWRAAWDRLVQLVTAAVFLAVAWQSWALIDLQWPFRTPGVGFPRAAFTVPLLIGLVLIGLDALRRVLDPGRPEPDPGHGGAL